MSSLTYWFRKLGKPEKGMDEIISLVNQNVMKQQLLGLLVITTLAAKQANQFMILYLCWLLFWSGLALRTMNVVDWF